MSTIVDGKKSNFPFGIDTFDTYVDNVDVIPSSGLNHMLHAVVALENELIATPQVSGANMKIAAATIVLTGGVTVGASGSIVLPTNAATSALATFLTSATLGPTGTATLLISARPTETTSKLASVAAYETTPTVATSSISLSSGWTSSVYATNISIAADSYGTAFTVPSSSVNGYVIATKPITADLSGDVSHFELDYGIQFASGMEIDLANPRLINMQEWYDIVLYSDTACTTAIDTIRIPIYNTSRDFSDPNPYRVWKGSILVGPNTWYKTVNIRGIGLKVATNRPKSLGLPKDSSILMNAEVITLRALRPVANAGWKLPVYEFKWWWADTTTKTIGYQIDVSPAAADTIAGTFGNFIISIIAIV